MRLRQFVPEEFCLRCQGCCRYKESDSVWVPCLLDEEIQLLMDKRIPPAAISSKRRLLAIPDPAGEEYLCPFLNTPDNKCKIYEFRPFECQLYPFLINLRAKKVILTVDLNCPYAKENLKSGEFKEYAEYLSAFLNLPRQIKLLKDNPQIIQAYEEVSDIVELKIPE